MLKKVIKYDFKTLWFPIVMLFAAAIVLPVLVYIFTIDLDEGTQRIFRCTVAGIVPSFVIIGVMLLSVINLESDFVDKNAYLIQVLPVKVKTLLFSKTLVFFIWSTAAIVVILLSLYLSFMDFTLFDVSDDIYQQIFGTTIADNPLLWAVLCFRVIFASVWYLGFGSADMAFSHLLGFEKRSGDLLFCLIFLIIAIPYWIMCNAVFPHDSNSTISSSFFYFDTIVNIVLPVGAFLFANWVYTKRINIK
jgi:hypothetical protein